MHLEVLPGVAAWGLLVNQLNRLPVGRGLVFLTAGSIDTEALDKYHLKPVLVKSLLDEGVLKELNEANPQVVVVPRLVARELEPAAHEIYTQRLIAVLEAGYTIETTLPIIAYEGVKDLLKPPIPWPLHAQVNGTFLRHYVGQYVLCDISPQAIINRLSRGIIEQPHKGQNGLTNYGVNLANIHRLRELMLRLATAHATDTTRQATLAPLTLPDDNPWSSASWRFSVTEVGQGLLSLAVTAGVLGYFFMQGYISLTAMAMGLLGVILVVSFNSNVLTTLISGIAASFWLAWLAGYAEFNLQNSSLLNGDIVLILAIIWVALLALKLRFRQEHRQTVEESQTRTLLRLVYDVGAIRLPKDILEEALLNLQNSLGLQTVYLPLENSELVFPTKRGLTELELSSAQEAMQSGAIQAPQALGQYLWCPVLSGDDMLGVLGVRHKHQQQSLLEPGYDFLAFIRTYSRLLGGAMRRAFYDIERTEAGHLASRESLRSSLLASVSHDLKTPLVSIIGSLSMLDYVGDGLPAAQRQELIGAALHEAERLHRIVHNVLEMAKLESGANLSSRTPIDAVDTLKLAAARLQPSYPQFKLELRDFSQGKLVWGDELLLSQVFTNLLENAAKYGLAGHAVVARFQADHANQRLMIEISSVGNPVAPEDLPRIFDKFYRSNYTDTKMAGSGLGLAICKAIVEAHDGTIEAEIVENEPGGMLFRVYLPTTKLTGPIT